MNKMHMYDESYGRPEEVASGIFRIRLPLPGNPLKGLNSYFIRGDDYDLLIDTGFRRQECQAALKEGLAVLRSKRDRRQVLCTHLHADHSGNADLFTGEGQPMYMTKTDLDHFARYLSRELNRKRFSYFAEGGFPEELLEKNERRNESVTMVMPHVDRRFVTLTDGDEIRVGSRALKVVMMAGHTPGNAMYYLEEEQIMFTGDHILFDITPNITKWPDMEDALGVYLDNLARAKRFAVKLALPGHRETGNYYERIDEIIAHHDRRLEETLAIVTEHPGLNAYEIAGRMKWKIRAAGWEDFPLQQKWFAVGECFSHLDYLLKRGKIRQTRGADGIVRHEAV